MRSAFALSLVALTVPILAGCLEDATKLADTNTNEAPAIAVDEKLHIEAKDCIQAGGNSVYGGKTKIGPFDSANALPELGNPRVGAFGQTFTYASDPVAPMNAAKEANGIWHVGTLCKSYTYLGKEYQDFQMGWIAELIERPTWDTWGDPRIEFMVADLSFNNADFVTATAEATKGAEISPGNGNVIEWYAPQKYMHVVISEASHGTFDFTAEIHKEIGATRTQHIRFWMLPRVDGHMHEHGLDSADVQDEEVLYRPISIDIYDTAKPGGKMLAGEALGTFVHINGQEQHQGNPLGHYWDGFDRVIEIGPAPEGMTFNRTWTH